MVKYFLILNKILMFITIGVFSFFCFKAFISLKEQNVNMMMNKSAVRAGLEAGSFNATLPPYSFYRKQIQKRNIFSFLEEKPVVQPKKVKPRKVVPREKVLLPPKVKAKPRVSPAFKKLKLVGVVLDKNSEAIVENPAKKETLFFHEGDEFEGAVVEQILEGKIIFLYEGQKIELVQ